MKLFKNNFVLSLVSGLLLGLSWVAISDIPYLLFVAFVPLFMMEKNGSKLSAFGWSYVSFFMFSLISSWWIWYASPEGALMALAFNALFMSTVFWMFSIVRRKLGDGPGYLSFIIFWLGFEYLHFHWDLSHPWLTLGNAFANHVYYIQWYKYTGVFGGSLLILLINVLIYKLFSKYLNGESIKTKLIQIGVVMLFPLLLSLIMIEDGNSEVKVSVVVTQPNIDAYSKFDGTYTMEEQINRIFDKIPAKKIDLIIAPETALANPLNENKLDYSMDYQYLNWKMEQYPSADLLIGMSSYGIFERKNSYAAVKMENGLYRESYNAAMIMRDDNNQIYHKSRLVLGVEKLPFVSLFSFVEDMAIQLGGASGTLTPEHTAKNLSLSNSDEIAPLICYESIYGGYVAEFVRKGAKMLAIITNDGWWRDTPGYKQHFAYARLRAIETGRWVARSANTGISGFISPSGEVIVATNWDEQVAIQYDVPMIEKNTFYVQYGDFIGRIAAFLSVIVFVWALISGYKDKI